MTARVALTALLLILAVQRSYGIIGYDCGAPQLNITTISLLTVGDCKISTSVPDVTRTYIQLLQISQYEKTRVMQCKVVIHRTIYYCGMNSHISVVANGQAEYIADIPHEQCIGLHTTGRLAFGINNYLDGFRINQTSSRPITLAGTITNNGDCKGVQYSDPYGTWSDVVVQAVITVTLQTYHAAVNMDADTIHLRSGVICTYSDITCVDIEGGHTFWNAYPWEHCSFKSYDVLYEGYVSKMKNKEDENSETVFSLTTQDMIFALTKKGHEVICGNTFIKTEHPKLLIFETTKDGVIIKRKPIATENLDIFTYVNSKFVYVERHVRTQITNLYRDVLMQRCNLEQQIIKNALSIATYSPDEFAYHFMKGPGYMAAVAGEVVHIIKCIPVELQVRHTEECYHQLPVRRKNEEFFIAPRTHVIIRRGTQMDCNSFIPAMYLLNSNWYKLAPKPVETPTPVIIEPMTKPTWRYINPGALATSGIYSEDDLQNLKDRINFPMEKPAILNAVVRTIQGQAIAAQGITLSNLFDETTLNKIAESTWTRIWGSFMYFGTASAGCIGLYLTFRVIKLIMDTAIHGYALHAIYGWSIYLLGAIWDSLTNLLLHLPHRPSPTKREAHEQVNTPETHRETQTDSVIHLPEGMPTAPSHSSLPDGDKIVAEILSRNIYPKIN